MIDDPKPYPAMKDSGLPWLGKVPEHWHIRKLRHILRRVTERSRSDLPLLSVVREKGVIRRDTTSAEENHNFIPDDLSNYKVVRVGQFAMNKMKAWQGSYGVSKFDGIVSPAYFVFDVTGVEGLFFHSAIRSRAYVPSFTQASDGVRIGQWDLAEARMREIAFVVPPFAEQDAIVRFLDHTNRRIERYIRAKKKLITLLNEQKQAIVHRAVTRGLDANVRVKPSGIPWLGEIPEQWGTTAVKRLAKRGTNTFIDGDWIETPFITSDGVRLIQTGNVGIGVFREKGFRYVSEGTFRSLKCTEVKPSDVLICRLDGPVGRACLAPSLKGKMITSVDNTILKVEEDVDARFVVNLMSSPPWLNWIQSICRAGGGFRYRVSRSMLGDIKVPKPPLSEQKRISDYLDRETANLNLIIEKIGQDLRGVMEYRTRLVADVVTGQLDVRDAAAKLPEEPPELERLDEVKTLSEEDDIVDDSGIDTEPAEVDT
jgi:type I restriction enzyme S subunit